MTGTKEPIANHLADQYFAMADREADKQTEAGDDRADRYWYLGAVCAYAADQG